MMIEHNGFAGRHHSDRELWSGLAKWFSDGTTGADELAIPGIEHDLAELAASAGLLQTRRDVAAFRITLRGLAGRNGFEAGLSRNARQQLRRAAREYRALGELRLEEAPTVERALTFFEGLKDLHIRSWTRRGKPHAFRFSFFERFHRALIVAGMQNRAVQLLRISAGSQTIGYLYNFRHGGIISAYQSGFDDSDPALRPGYLCHGLAIEAAIAEDVQAYDFLAGSNRLKQSFGREHYVLSWQRLARPRLRFRAEAAARAIANRIRKS